MNNLEEQLKKIEIQEKKLRNRTIWLSALVPVLSIVLSLLTTYLTVRKEFDIDKLDYTQERINAVMKDQSIIDARQKLKFLIESDLIGDKNNKVKLLDALDRHLINKNESINQFLKGVEYFDAAYDFKVPKDSISNYYAKAIDKLLKSLELNPLNYEAITYLAASYYNIAYELSLNTFYELALAEYNRALQINSTLSYVHLDKAKTLDKLRRYDEACKEIRIALKIGGLDSLRNVELNELKKRRCTSNEIDKDGIDE